MDTKETRRENLGRWVAANGVPRAEKSFFSQLQSATASFGEKVARRLEKQYKMGDGYLDTPGAEVAKVDAAGETRVAVVEALTAKCETAEEQQLLTAYRLTNEAGRIAFRATMKNVLIHTEVARNKAQ